MDAHDFDALTRRLAAGMNRRGFLRAAIGGVAAAMMTRAGITTAQTGSCPGGAGACNGVCCSHCERCYPAGGPNRKCVSDCSKGLTCIQAECVCPDGNPVCGQGESAACCEGDAVCENGVCVCPPTSGGRCVHAQPTGPDRVVCCAGCETCRFYSSKWQECQSKCPDDQFCGESGQCECSALPGAIPCGPEGYCCIHGCDESGSQCACPAGHTLCGAVHCCDVCQTCDGDWCMDQCPYSTICSDGYCRCPDGQPVCGNECCEGVASCVNGSCVCPNDSDPCRSLPADGLETVRCCHEQCESCKPVQGQGNLAREYRCEWTCPKGTICDDDGCDCPRGSTVCGSSKKRECCDTVCGYCQGGKCKSKCESPLTCLNNECVCPDGQPACFNETTKVIRCCTDGAVCGNGDCGCPPDRDNNVLLSRCAAKQPASSGVDEIVTCCAGCEHCSNKGTCVSACAPVQTCEADGLCYCPDGQSDCKGVCCGACQVCVDESCKECLPPAECNLGVCQCPIQPRNGIRPPLCGNTCCFGNQSCVSNTCLCPDETTACSGECCDAAECEVCGPGGCEKTCDGPCNTCDEGECLPVLCADDGNICTENVCVPAEGGCVAVPIEYCCETDDDCPDDGNPCTRVVCDTAINRCDVQLVNEVECDDGNPCTGPGQCGGGECHPGPSLCGPCEMCAETGCVDVVNGVGCLDGGVCCDGDCLPACPLPQVMTDDCSCACPEVVNCDEGSTFDPNSCACCRTACLPGECGKIPNGCGGEPLQCTEGCCEAITCEEAGAMCGPIDNGCGEHIFCGECEPPNTCGGGGVANQCGCTGMTCEEAGVTCGWLEDDGCGKSRDCGPCGNACGACTPFGSSCVSDGECCSGFCDLGRGLCSYGAFDYVCYANGEPCPDPAQTEAMCCGTCADGCCTCVGLWGSCDDPSQCCEGTCFGYPDPSICCRAPGEACTPETAAECCTGRCVDGVCDCAAFGDRCELGLVDCCEFPNSCLRNVCSPI